jgi:hypothetical protein
LKNDEKAADIHMPATPQNFARKGFYLKPPNIFRKNLQISEILPIFAQTIKNYMRGRNLVQIKKYENRKTDSSCCSGIC